MNVSINIDGLNNGDVLINIGRDEKIRISHDSTISQTTTTTPIEDNKTTKELENSLDLKQRVMDSFTCNDYQYVRIGEVYGKITQNDILTTISRSCYYANRKKAGCGKK